MAWGRGGRRGRGGRVFCGRFLLWTLFGLVFWEFGSGTVRTYI
jgi:hypothetical protein